MRLDASTRRRLRLQHWIFLLLFGLVIGLLAWLSVRYPIQLDWTAGGRNTLSIASQTVLARLEGPVRITAYIGDRSPRRESLARLVARYQRHQPQITLHFLNPDLLPDQARQLGISSDGELYVEYGGRGEKVAQPSEQALTQALQRLTSPRDRLVLFLDGHGERQLQGSGNHELGAFGRELEKIGIQPQPLSLAKTGSIPIGTAALVIASPQTPPAPEEIRLILDYVQQGGQLLWLLEPGDQSGWLALAAWLGITALPGVIVDADAPRLGIKHPALIPIADYGLHPITTPLRHPALLPQALALDIQPVAGWQAAVLLETQASSWTETSALNGQVQFDPESVERAGPLTVGMALFRPHPVKPGAEQRIVVIGDGDFLANAYLGHGANLELGLNILNWLTLDEALMMVPLRSVPDPVLNLSEGALAGLAALFLLIMPIGFFASGWLIRFYRRRG